jgi:hypothetical protein
LLQSDSQPCVVLLVIVHVEFEGQVLIVKVLLLVTDGRWNQLLAILRVQKIVQLSGHLLSL